MDDLERAMLISFDESGTIDPGLKSQAVAFCNQLKDDPSICCICIERLSFTNFAQVRFWCLQALHESLRLRYSSVSPEEKSYIRKSLISMADQTSTSFRLLESQPFTRNKLAQVLVTFIYFEYPSIWPSVLLDLLSG